MALLFVPASEMLCISINIDCVVEFKSKEVWKVTVLMAARSRKEIKGITAAGIH